MDNLSIIGKISTLPQHILEEVNDFIDFKISQDVKDKKISPKPVLGSGKGMFVLMPDFEEPLEDFKDYM